MTSAGSSVPLERSPADLGPDQCAHLAGRALRVDPDFEAAVRALRLEQDGVHGHILGIEALEHSAHRRNRLPFANSRPLDVSKSRGLRSSTRKLGALLELFGLSAVAVQDIGLYSKGMKQEVMTIAALLHDPDVLVLDEPDSLVPVDGHNVVHLGDEGPGSYTTASRDRTGVDFRSHYASR